MNDKFFAETSKVSSCIEASMKTGNSELSLFQSGVTTLSSGAKSDWKIDCDALSDGDIYTVAKLIEARVPAFSRVIGVPRGGLRLAAALAIYTDPEAWYTLLVDDVITTGSSLEKLRASFDGASPVVGAVIFARGPVPDWVTALWTMVPVL